MLNLGKENNLRTLSTAMGLCILLVGLLPIVAVSQISNQLEPRFAQILTLIRGAEVAGATSEEIAQFVASLNRALRLNEQAIRLSKPEESQQRLQTISEMNAILDEVENKSMELESVSAQRTFMSRAFAFLYAAGTALLLTIIYVIANRVWGQYRIKRAFQMSILPK